jgi:ribosomal protein S18 acetylase RimI-like enzyme
VKEDTHMTENITTRALRPEDLETVVQIDRERSGRSRTEFYAKRFRTLADDPGSVIAVAAQAGKRLVGFSFAHVLDGEFGAAAPVGVLDAIGVLPDQEREGIATALLSGLERALAERGVRELRTQADWTEHGIAAFFSASGFRLAPRVVLERALDRPVGDDFAWEDLPVRSMAESDLPAIIRLDRKITGRDRTAYLTRKASEVARDSAIRMSLVAEVDGKVAGFLMARVDFGEFGRAEPIAVLDTIGVAPDRARQRVGRALLEQLLLNLASLRAEQVVTEVSLDQVPLLAFLGRTGFARSQRLAFEKAIA